MADNYNNGPMWHRPGSGMENPADNSFEDEMGGGLFSGFPGGISGDDEPPRDVEYETQPEQDSIGDPFSGRYAKKAPDSQQNNQYNQYDDQYTPTPAYDTARSAEEEARELAYYFAKGRGTKEPTARMVEMTATGKGFNIPAFFLGIFYLLYRKLYLEAAIAYGFAFIVTMFTNQTTNMYVTLAVSIAFGLLFPFLYHNKMEKKIDDAVKLNQDIRTYLTNTGGTNIILPVILAVIYVAATLLLSFTG